MLHSSTFESIFYSVAVAVGCTSLEVVVLLTPDGFFLYFSINLTHSSAEPWHEPMPEAGEDKLHHVVASAAITCSALTFLFLTLERFCHPRIRGSGENDGVEAAASASSSSNDTDWAITTAFDFPTGLGGTISSCHRCLTRGCGCRGGEGDSTQTTSY